MRVLLIVICALVALPAYAEEVRNPDVPFGLMAVDLSAGIGFNGTYDVGGVVAGAIEADR